MESDSRGYWFICDIKVYGIRRTYSEATYKEEFVHSTIGV